MPQITEEIIFSSDPANGALEVNADGDSFTVQFDRPVAVPSNAKNVNIQMIESVVWFTTPNITESNQNLRITGPDTTDAIQVYDIVIPVGLYDLTGLSAAILRELDAATPKAKQEPYPLITVSADDATSKVVLYLNYTTVTVDFSVPNSIGPVLGFSTDVGDNPVGPVAVAPSPIVAPDVARFNAINSFLIHCDLARAGIRLNNTYSQVIGNPLITVAPGRQIIYSPQYPPIIEANHLAGAQRTRVRSWLTDEQNRRVNTAGEYWSFRLRLSYFVEYEASIPHIM